MARKARVQFAGAVYHVLDRGDRREAIFHDDMDRELFLQTLDQACRRTGWFLHAFVLMSNHYHLLVETPEGNLAAGMQLVEAAGHEWLKLRSSSMTSSVAIDKSVQGKGKGSNLNIWH